jgi:hypothetical protein
VFLAYRLPREPSAPRIALWRALRRLGTVLVADGLVALPNSARNLEHFEWLAAGIHEDRGSASVWLARPSSAEAGNALAAQIRQGADEEYQAIQREARAARSAEPAERRRTLRRLRGALRRVSSRDYLEATSGAAAHAAVELLAIEEVPAWTG